MSFLLSVLGAISDLAQWCIGYGQRSLGKQEQQNVDAKQTIKTLEAEKDSAAQRPDAADELRKNDF